MQTLKLISQRAVRRPPSGDPGLVCAAALRAQDTALWIVDVYVCNQGRRALGPRECHANATTPELASLRGHSTRPLAGHCEWHSLCFLYVLYACVLSPGLCFYYGRSLNIFIRLFEGSLDVMRQSRGCHRVGWRSRPSGF